MQRKLISVLTLFLVAVPLVVWGVETSKVGTAGAQFLKIGVGPRAVGMGEAFTAVVDDPSSMFWNPSGLAQVKRPAAFFVHTNWLATTYHEYFGFAYPLGLKGVLGFNATILNMGTMEETTIDQPNGTGRTFGASDWAVGGTFASNLTDRFSAGINVKYVQEQIWDLNANGFAFDLGTTYRTGFKSLRIAMTITNFGGDLKFSGGHLDTAGTFTNWPPGYETQALSISPEAYPLPLRYRIGAPADIVQTEPLSITTAVDLVHPSDGSEQVNMGVEWVFSRVLALRSGYRYNPDMHRSGQGNFEGFSGGAGVIASFGTTKGRLDYAYSNHGWWLGGSHSFGVGLEFEVQVQVQQLGEGAACR